MPTAEHDYSRVRARLAPRLDGGAAALLGWLLSDPNEVEALAREVRVLDVNRAGLALLRARSRADATASLVQYLTRESLPALARALVTLLAEGRLVDCELPLRDRAGRELTVLASASPLPGSEETLEHVLVGFVDVTERKEAERRLRESEALLRESQTIARIGHFVIDLEQGRWTSSEALDELVGIGPAWERTLRGWRRLLHPDDREAETAFLIDEAIGAGRSMYRECRIVRPSDGAVRWVRGRGELELSALGRPLRMIGTVQDVTEEHVAAQERQRFAEQLRQAQKMESLGRLAGGVAHDFNNLLGVILGHADLALQAPELSADTRESLRAVQDAAVRSAELTRQLLGFARQQPIKPRPLDLGWAVTSMAHLLEGLAGDGIRIELRLAEGLWPACVDPSQVDQVLTNLVANARDATAGAGTIRIETSNVTVETPHAERTFQVAPGDYATVAVTDQGSGMDDVALRHLFEPFFTTKPAGRGTGLGLATVYGIVRQNRGGVEVRTAVGEGTTLRVLFPRHRVEGDAPR